MVFERYENETDDELIYRLGCEKHKIGNWCKIASILNDITGYSYDESTYRKKYKSLCKLIDQQQVWSNSELIKQQLEAQKIKKERIKLSVVNLEQNRLSRSEAKQELYYEQVGKACSSLPLPDFKPLPENTNVDTHEYLVTLCDIHYGAHFESINNKYSPEIAKERLLHLAEKLIVFIQEHHVRILHIASLGDLIQGILRINDLKINDSSVVRATVEISRLIALFLRELSAYTQIKYYHVPTSNHSQIRFLNAKANQLADEDMEYVIGNYIKDLCASNERIQVYLEENKSYLKFEILGNKIIAMHGHQVKSLNNVVKDMTVLSRDFIDYVIMGHQHCSKEISSTEGVINDTEVLVCPSFVGSDPYADSLFVGSKSAVKIYGFSEQCGHDETYKIVLN